MVSQAWAGTQTRGREKVELQMCQELALAEGATIMSGWQVDQDPDKRSGLPGVLCREA